MLAHLPGHRRSSPASRPTRRSPVAGRGEGHGAQRLRRAEPGHAGDRRRCPRSASGPARPATRRSRSSQTTVQYPPGQAGAAQLVARHLAAGAALQPSPQVKEITVISGPDYTSVLQTPKPASAVPVPTTTTTTTPSTTTTAPTTDHDRQDRRQDRASTRTTPTPSWRRRRRPAPPAAEAGPGARPSRACRRGPAHYSCPALSRPRRPDGGFVRGDRTSPGKDHQ